MSAVVIAPKSYSAIHKALHWIVAVIIIEQLVLGEFMSDAWRAFERSADASGLSSPVVLFHIWGGLSVVVFAVWRLFLRRSNGVPETPKDEPAALKLAGNATHVILYALMFLVPLSGAMAYFGVVSLAGDFHKLMKPVLIVLVGIHVAGALYQHFWLKSNVLKRMLNS
jgi:cytochrome b561